MGKQLDGQFYVANGQEVQLHQAPSTGAVNRQQDCPGEAAADQADGPKDSEIAEEQEAVEGAVAQDVRVRHGQEGLDPVEPSRR